MGDSCVAGKLRDAAFDLRQRTQHRLGSQAAVQTAPEAALSLNEAVSKLKK